MFILCVISFLIIHNSVYCDNGEISPSNGTLQVIATNTGSTTNDSIIENSTVPTNLNIEVINKTESFITTVLPETVSNIETTTFSINPDVEIVIKLENVNTSNAHEKHLTPIVLSKNEAAPNLTRNCTWEDYPFIAKVLRNSRKDFIAVLFMEDIAFTLEKSFSSNLNEYRMKLPSDVLTITKIVPYKYLHLIYFNQPKGRNLTTASLSISEICNKPKIISYDYNKNQLQCMDTVINNSKCLKNDNFNLHEHLCGVIDGKCPNDAAILICDNEILGVTHNKCKDSKYIEFVKMQIILTDIANSDGDDGDDNDETIFRSSVHTNDKQIWDLLFSFILLCMCFLI